MKKGTPRHPKVKRLARRLLVDLPHAVGLLEMLWHYTAEFYPAGDVGRATDDDIHEAVNWNNKKRQSFVKALVAEGFLDENADCRLIVHDWANHAEDSVHLKLSRQFKYFADGTTPKYTRLTGPERARVERFYGKPDAHDMRTECAQDARGAPQEGQGMEGEGRASCSLDTTSTEVSLERRLPEKGNPWTKQQAKEILASLDWHGLKNALKFQPEVISFLESIDAWMVPDDPSLNSLSMIWARLEWFREWWELPYWRKDAKQAAMLAYFETVKTLELHEKIITATLAQMPGMMKREKESRPQGASWINGTRWEDEVSKTTSAEGLWGQN